MCLFLSLRTNNPRSGVRRFSLVAGYACSIGRRGNSLSISRYSLFYTRRRHSLHIHNQHSSLLTRFRHLHLLRFLHGVVAGLFSLLQILARRSSRQQSARHARDGEHADHHNQTNNAGDVEGKRVRGSTQPVHRQRRTDHGDLSAHHVHTQHFSLNLLVRVRLCSSQVSSAYANNAGRRRCGKIVTNLQKNGTNDGSRQRVG